MMLPMNDQEQRNAVLGRIYAKADVEALRSVALDPEEVTDAK